MVSLFSVNGITAAPRSIVMNTSVVAARKPLEKRGVEISPIAFDDAHEDADSMRCDTMRGIGDPGPTTVT